MNTEGVLERVEMKRLVEGAGAAFGFFRSRILPPVGAFTTRYLLVPFYRLGTRVIARLVWRPRLICFDKLPKKGPALLICNHVSYLDGFLLYAASKRPIRFLIDGDILHKPGVHYFMTLAKAISILPTRDSVTRAFAEVSQALKDGDLVCIFPEGTLTRTGSLGRFKPGVEWILKRDPVPVYPMAVTGLWGSVFSRKYGKSWFPWWPRHWRLRITLICGDPLPPQDATINRLQREVLKLKYLAAQQ